MGSDFAASKVVGEGVRGIGRVALVALGVFAWGCGGSGGSKGGVDTEPATGGRGGSGSGGTGSGGTTGTAGAGGSNASGGTAGGNASGDAGGGVVDASGGLDAGVEIDAASPEDALTDDALGGGGTADASVDTRPTLPTAKVPAPWIGEDIGMVGVPGGAGRGTEQYIVRGSGGDVFGASDQFYFLHRAVTGDVDVIARLASLEHTSGDAKAGLMFRESNAVDARNVFLELNPASVSEGVVTAGKGTRLQYRDKRTDTLTSFQDQTSVDPNVPDSAPIWLRLVRKGNTFTGYVSGDGVTWKLDGTVTIPTMPPELLVGPAVTSHTNSDAAIAAFDHLSLTALTDAAWTHTEVGTLGGLVSGSPASFKLESAGRGLTNKKDGVALVHEAAMHVGDIELTGHITTLASPGQETLRAGFMIRGGADEGARMASFLVELGPKNGQRYLLIRRAQDDGNISTSTEMVADGGAPPDAGEEADAGAPTRPTFTPVWIKLVRVGNRFAGYVSEDGRRWGDPVIDLPSFVIAENGFIGAFATSGTEGATANATFERVTAATVTTKLPALPDAAAPPPASDAGAQD